MRRTIIIIVLLTLLPDVYIWLCHLRCAPVWLQLAWWLPAVLLLLTIWEFFARHRHHVLSIRLFFTYLLCVSLPKLSFSVVAPLAGWPVGLTAGGIVLLLSLDGFTLGTRRLKVRHVSAAWPTVPPAFDGYRVVHLSDIHAGSLGRRSRMLQRVAEAVNAEHADLIVCTGDHVNQSASELTPYLYILSSLQSADGVYTVLGNHDFVGNVDELCAHLHSMGWHVLRNCSVALHRGDEHITLIGVDNISTWVFARHGNLSEAMAHADEDSFQILLTHDPAHWRAEVAGVTHIDLTLSGHTHGGQLRIGHWSPAKRFARHWWGWYHEGAQRLHVSAGISGAFPFRLGAWPEVTVITIKRDTQNSTNNELCGRTRNF